MALVGGPWYLFCMLFSVSYANSTLYCNDETCNEGETVGAISV